MARLKNTFWHRNKFKLSGLLLILPIYFLYESLQPPEFPDVWESKSVGQLELALQPMNNEPPYAHHEDWVKDFSVWVNDGAVKNIRQAYINIGPRPLPLNQLEQDDVGILHGSDSLQHVHAIAPRKYSPSDQVWLTLQNWDGSQHVQSWSLPPQWVPAS